ncbi:MAG: hypothetical protein K2H64_02400 [Desulfovibrio sp.]|nr:hypothetical protein [Desulfovibrio sp.]
MCKRELELFSPQTSFIIILGQKFYNGERPKYLDKESILLAACGHFVEDKNSVFYNRKLLGIVKNHGKTVDQVSQRWVVQSSIGVIPKSASNARMGENLGVCDHEFSGCIRAVFQFSGSKGSIRSVV